MMAGAIVKHRTAGNRNARPAPGSQKASACNPGFITATAGLLGLYETVTFFPAGYRRAWSAATDLSPDPRVWPKWSTSVV